MSSSSSGSDDGREDPLTDVFRAAEAHLPSGAAGAAGGNDWDPVDLLLEQGAPEELAEMRRAVATDPLRALEMADTVQLIEQFRTLRTEASPVLAGKLQSVVLQAGRAQHHRLAPRGLGWQLPTAFAAAAGLTFWALCALGVAAPSVRSGKDDLAFARVVATAERQRPAASSVDVSLESVLGPGDVDWQENVRSIQRRLEVEDGAYLRTALEAGLEGRGKDLSKWLDPANAVTMMRLGHELRASAALRTAALRDAGALPEVDRRVQTLAAGLARAVPELISAEDSVANHLEDVSWAVRALIGAGAAGEQRRALGQGGAWLAASLDDVYDERLVIALSSLVEVAAISGEHFDEVSEHGRRLIQEVLEADGETWRRRRPALLAGMVSPGILGDAGRLVARLPAFGVDADRCTLVRQLCLGQLREQRASGQDRPEVLAAMTYGYADLLNEAGNEGDRLAWSLQRWKPARLAPDFVTVQQMAWSLAPGSRGHTRMQRELRQLSVMDAPVGLRDRAAFCLCLATNYAGDPRGLAEAARGRRGS